MCNFCGGVGLIYDHRFEFLYISSGSYGSHDRETEDNRTEFRLPRKEERVRQRGEGRGERERVGEQRQRESGVHSRLAIVRLGVSHHMGRMLNAEFCILTYFHQTDTEIL